MKTAINDLIDYIELVKKTSGHSDITISGLMSYINTHSLIKEKQQIINAYEQGISDQDDAERTGDDYYTDCYDL